MNQSLKQAAESVVARARAKGFRGATADKIDLLHLNDECGGVIPDWYVELLTQFPLCGLELGWQAFKRQPGFDGIAWLEWNNVESMRSEMTACYPGVAIRSVGYVNVANDAYGGADPYFLAPDQSGDPPLCQVLHDVGEDPHTILAEGLRLVAPSLSEFFRTARLRRRSSRLG